MYTIDDYFDYTSGDSPCGIQQQEDIDYLSKEFDDFLSSIGCQRTFNSEWYYNSPHSGIHAVTNSDTVYYDPRECDEECVASNWREFWNARVGRMKAIHEFLEKREAHLNEAPYYWCKGYARRRDLRYQNEFDVAQSAYVEFIEDTLEEICGMYESDLYDACEWCESDEAAQRWVDAQNDIEMYMARKNAERNFENMVGTTATSDSYMA